MVNLSFYANTGTDDSARGESGVEFTLVDAADTILWSDGSTDVADGEATPTEAELNAAAPMLGVADDEIDKCFLMDNSAGTLKQIHNAGSVNKRYVFNFYFDGATASEPVLEAWDDSDHDSNDLYCLGEGTGTNSWLYAVRTTAGAPGASWVGTPISGNGVSSSLQLNGGAGALAVATNVYVNMKVVIPGGFATPASESPVITIRYSYN